jgi:hypothetical protein
MNVRLYDRGGMKSEAETYELKGHRHESALWEHTDTREVASEELSGPNFSAEFESFDHVQESFKFKLNSRRICIDISFGAFLRDSQESFTLF